MAARFSKFTFARRLAPWLCAIGLQWAAPGSAQQVYSPGPQEAPEVAILAPAHDEMVYDNNGRVVVNLAVRELEPDEEIVLLLDQEEVARDSNPPAFIVLNQLNRGTHQLQVQIVDGDGDVVAESQVSSFYVWKASRLFRGL
jgi:hypothetical protein